MMYEKEILVLDFARRTKKNLDFVRSAAKKENPTEAKIFEFTQLINSMLGLLVFPKEKHWKKYKNKRYAELIKQGWPKISSSEGFSDAKTLEELLRYIRDAITHGQIEFLPKGGKLNGVKLWRKNRSGTKDWEAELSKDDLEKFTNKFIEMLEEEYSQIIDAKTVKA